MMKHTIVYATALFLLVGVYGCGGPSASDPATQPSSASGDDGHSEHAGHDHGGHAHDDGLSDMDKMKAELSKLSAADATSVEKQHFCPVSSEMLGTMGPPLKVDVNGRNVWICCEGCRDRLLNDPQEYLANLNDN